MASMKQRQEKVPSSPLTSVDSSFLKTLVGYNTRRATLKILGVFTERMDALSLKPVEFSILSLIGRNPGLTPSQLCVELGLLPPNLTKTAGTAGSARSGGAPGAGCRQARRVPEPEPIRPARVASLEIDATSALTQKQRETLITLLQKIYG
jgi:hypothetical protein